MFIFLLGLEVLIEKEERFRNYRNDLFSYKSKELDRELVGIEDNDGINASIRSYLRLLSGYLELSSAVNTLEYLIRRYKCVVFSCHDKFHILLFSFSVFRCLLVKDYYNFMTTSIIIIL